MTSLVLSIASRKRRLRSDCEGEDERTENPSHSKHDKTLFRIWNDGWDRKQMVMVFV